MKLKTFLIIAAASMSFLPACKKDNFDAPSSVLKGRIVYNGQVLGVRSPTVNAQGTSTTGGVQLELWQYGYQLFTKVPVYVNQDGSFSASLFDGNYKLVRLGGAPWQNSTDSIDIKLNGTLEIDVPVVPYFTISNPTVTFNKADSTISASFTVTNVVAGKNLEVASLSVGATQFVDVVNQVVTKDESVAAGAQVSMKINIRPGSYPEKTRKELLNQILHKQYAFVRVGAKTQGVGERIYSTVQKVELK